jgi:hypothetical protein
MRQVAEQRDGMRGKLLVAAVERNGQVHRRRQQREACR